MKRRKPRNPIARVLRSPAFRQRTVRCRKTYTRKGRPPPDRNNEDPRGRAARPPGLRAARGKPRYTAALRGGGW